MISLDFYAILFGFDTFHERFQIMTTYKAPIEDMMFTLEQVIGFENLPEASAMDAETTAQILEEAGKFAADVLAPLNFTGDRQGSYLNGVDVKTPDGFKEAYAQFCEMGWNGPQFDEKYGGMNLPSLVTFALQEMWQAANLSFGLCPMLTQAGIEAIEKHGTDEQKDLYLSKLVSGEWTGSMQLTEPDAGSDLGNIKTKAEKQDDGTYLIKGQKIYITYGEHDFTDNIIHMVLARTGSMEDGVKGLSLFIVPKFMVEADGSLGARNDAKAIKLEEKLGIHASPTCIMQFGDEGGAKGFLVGAEGAGLINMFTMMNVARLGVGVQGVAVAERAYQHALNYAQDRKQGVLERNGDRVAIIEHPDVQRMLLTMRAQIEAGRTLSYEAGLLLDQAAAGNKEAAQKVNLLTPVVKGWCTDMAVRVASEGVQVHGGMGFIEETGAAQYYRDARILPIYEGTNAIQSNALLRAVLSDKGETAQAVFADFETIIQNVDYETPAHENLSRALNRLKEATEWLLSQSDTQAVSAVSVPYLNLFGYVACGAMMAKRLPALEDMKESNAAHAKQKRASILAYMAHVLPMTEGFFQVVISGADSIIK
jgi:alkylation response protein AidB-like acyl-CoA dehydrogenase